MGNRVTVPNVVIAQRVVDKMAAAASQYIEDETGEAMVGLLIPAAEGDDAPTIYVLDTISPDESALRQLHTFQQGDERQDELRWWLQENWRVHREQQRGQGTDAARWDHPLRYLGDWHKQPGSMIKPSDGDRMTALDWLDDNDMDALLVPIVTIGPPPPVIVSAGPPNFITVQQDATTMMRVDFWYIHQDARDFQPVTPVIMADSALPALQPYPWHLVNEERAEEELDLLQRDGLFVSVVLWNASGTLPLDVCILMARQGADRMLMVFTPWNYPEQAPFARTVPFTVMKEGDTISDIFDDLWPRSQAVADPPGWRWSPEKRLLDYVRALEEALGMGTGSRPLLAGEPETPDTTEEKQ